MKGQLPHVIYQAVTCPQFREQLLTDFDAALSEHDLAREEMLAIREVLSMLAPHQRDLTLDQQPDLKSGWAEGPSFTGTVV